MAFRRIHSAEARAKMSASQKAALRDPAALAKRLHALDLATEKWRVPCPAGTRRLYDKLRDLGISREEALEQCRRAANEATEGRPACRS